MTADERPQGPGDGAMNRPKVQVVNCYVCGASERFEMGEAFHVTAHVCADCTRAAGDEWVGRRMREGPVLEGSEDG